MKISCFLGLGSNLGNKIQNISIARRFINNEIGEIISESSLYKSEPCGFISENYFVNQVINISTNHNPEEILVRIHDIEKKLGRIKTKTDYEDRTIDIDILLYSDMEIIKPDLIIPHPMLIKRNFVLVPLVEIAPNSIHPVFNKTFVQLLRDCPDKSKVAKY